LVCNNIVYPFSYCSPGAVCAPSCRPWSGERAIELVLYNQTSHSGFQTESSGHDPRSDIKIVWLFLQSPWPCSLSHDVVFFLKSPWPSNKRQCV
jgi:hypothetical protein